MFEADLIKQDDTFITLFEFVNHFFFLISALWLKFELYALPMH